MEGTEDSAGIMESFKKRNTDEWTKGRQNKMIEEIENCRFHVGRVF